jgi:protease I
VVGFICHGAWVPISAKVVKGKKVTSHPAVQGTLFNPLPPCAVASSSSSSFLLLCIVADDLVNAGAEWVDEPCVVDGKLVSAQLPKDLPAFMKAILNLLE